MVSCSKCGNEIELATKFCPNCGNAIENTNPSNVPTNQERPRLQRPPEWKSESTTLLLTIIFGIFGLGGIGHIYIGKLLRGLVILIVGIILLVIAIASTGIGLIVLIPFAIWVVFDARKLCREYNDHYEKTGSPPSW